MHILLTNDDGIHHPGLRALAAALEKVEAVTKITLVAPHLERSGIGHAITYRTPIIVDEVFEGGSRIGYSVHAYPADCVKLGLSQLTDKPVDLVISGINAGINPGIHILYSGTVGAALEAAYLRKPTLAVSLDYESGIEPALFQQAAKLVEPIIHRALAGWLQPGHLWNINIPLIRPGWPRGVRVTHQATDGWREQFEHRTSPGGQAYYWVTGTLKFDQPEPGSDVEALEDGYISVTPLSFDLTHTDLKRDLQDRSWDTPDF